MANISHLETTDAETIKIVEHQIWTINQSLTTQIIAVRVGNKCGDAAMVSQAKNEMMRLERMRDEFIAILDEIQAKNVAH
jgi:hypothetical protein